MSNDEKHWLICKRLERQGEFDGTSNKNASVWKAIAEEFVSNFKVERNSSSLEAAFGRLQKPVKEYCQTVARYTQSGAVREDIDKIQRPAFADLFEKYGFQKRPLNTPVNTANKDTQLSDLEELQDDDASDEEEGVRLRIGGNGPKYRPGKDKEKGDGDK
eukprot:4588649-Pyramimonas_sp.AAC.1